MMLSDAMWLESALARFRDDELSPLLNLGSSTRNFREAVQPYIHDHVFRPLTQRDVRVVHSDLKLDEGVDLAGDIFDDAVLARIKAIEPRTLLCTHMFEHVKDRAALAERILSMLPKGGLFFVTVPKSYHYHADPIDTMFRPSPDELAALFPGQEIIERRVLVGGSYVDHFKKRPLTLFFRHFFRFFVPFFGWRKWQRSMRKLYWLFHPYEITAIIGRKV